MGILPSQLKKFVAGQQIVKVNAILKKLTTKGLVKSLTSVMRGGKKVFMDSEVEPNADVTGGMTGADFFDIVSIELVMERTVSQLKKKGSLSHRELLVYMRQLGVLPTERVRDDDLDQII